MEPLLLQLIKIKINGKILYSSYLKTFWNDTFYSNFSEFSSYAISVAINLHILNV